MTTADDRRHESQEVDGAQALVYAMVFGVLFWTALAAVLWLIWGR